MPRAYDVAPVARLVLAAALACVLVALAGMMPGQAAAAPTNYVVRSTADSGGTCPGATCTLRQAIATAVAGDSISFNLPNPSTITLTTGELGINKDLTISGPGVNKLTVSGSDLSRVFNVTGGIVSISDLIITDGNAGSNTGGAIRSSAGSLTLTKVVVRDSAGTDGGGISATAGVAVSVIDSTISGNTATTYHGGGISLGGAGASLTMSGSTVSGNNASTLVIDNGFGGGGGISIHTNGTATITNSTIANNSSVTRGSGLAAIGGANVSLTHVTASGNTAFYGDAGGITTQASTIAIKSSVIAASSFCANFGGTITNNGYNVDGGTSCGFGSASGSISGVDPLLATLGDYGGPTQTMALLPGSPAIDRVPGTGAGCPATDQRGVTRPRPAAGACDSGAVEVRRFSINRDGGNNQSAVINTAFTTPLGVIVASDNSEPVAGGIVTFTGPGSGAGIQGSPLTATIGSDGKASVSVTANDTTGGPYTVTASGAGTNGGVNFNLTNLPIPTTLLANNASGTYGGTTTLSAKLTATSGGAGVEGKTIIFTLNGTQVCNNAGGGYPAACPPTDASGVATLGGVSLGTIGVGNHPGYVGASFTTDSTHGGDSDNARLTITQAATSVTSVAATPSSIVYGTVSVILSTTLSNTSNDAALTGGSVVFAITDGGVTTYCTVTDTTVSGSDPVTASAICTFTSFPPVGNATITATYSGDTNFVGSSATPGSLTITQAQTSVTNVAASPPSIVYGTASVSLSATLSNTSNDAALTGGSVAFAVTNGGATTYCTVTDTTVSGADPVTATGTCTFTSFPPVGGATITATYSGDDNFQGSTGSGSLTITQAGTSTSIGTIAPPPACGDPTITVPVTVSNTSNDAALTGGTATVQIKQGTTVFGTGTATVSGADPVTVNVAVPVGGLPTGVYTITASYGGDGNFIGSSAESASFTIVKANATVLVPTVTATYGDGSVTLLARVTSVNGAPIDGGTVTFRVKKGSQLLATLTSGAVSGASPVTVSVSLPLSATYNAGSYTVEASYSGSACFNPASDTGTLTVARKVVWLKPTDRTVILRAANPSTDPHGDPACPAPSYCLELTRSSSFAYGQSWSALSLTSLRFQYARNPPSTNATEYVGKSYRITAFGVSSTNYDIRYDPGTMTVVAAP